VSLVIEEPRFALVPEWVIDAPVPDSSFRLYCLLLRYGGTSGQRMPSRTTLARRLRRSVDAVDRAMKELVAAGVVRVEHRRDGQRYLSNRYHVRTSSPFPLEAAAASAGSRRTAATPLPQEGGRSSAATSASPAGGRSDAATPGRGSAAGVAADVRPDREVLTESTPPPPPPRPIAASVTARSGRERGEEVGGDSELLTACGVEDLADVTRRCVAARRALGLSPTRWAGPCLAAALHLAVRGRGWPGELAVAALLAVAADPASRSPMRLAEAGPWWDQVAAVPGAEVGAADGEHLAVDEQRLDDLPGGRHVVQAAARAELAREGMPLTRATVVRRACEILDREAAG